MSELCFQHTVLFVGDITWEVVSSCIFFRSWIFTNWAANPPRRLKMNLKDALLAVHWPNLAIKFLTQDKEKLWAMRWRQWNWLQTWLQICGREWILANCNQTTQTKLNALSYEAPTSCYTQDSCECKGHHATWSNLAATQAETPELFCRFSMIFHDFARSISQHQESKYKNSRNSMEPGSHWSLTSPFFCISWIVFFDAQNRAYRCHLGRAFCFTQDCTAFPMPRTGPAGSVGNAEKRMRGNATTR